MIVADPDLSGELRISTQDFDLSPLCSEDAEDILSEFSDPDVTRWMDIDPLQTVGDAMSIITWAESQRALGVGVRWTIRRREDHVFTGTCGFNNIVLERGRRGEIAYDLDRRWQRRGVMGQVLPAVIGFGWDRLGLHRQEAMVTPGNDRSCALLERHGFAREGVLSGYGFWKGRFWDQIVYGLTRREAIATL